MTWVFHIRKFLSSIAGKLFPRLRFYFLDLLNFNMLRKTSSLLATVLSLLKMAQEWKA